MSTPSTARRGRPGYDRATVLTRSVELFNTQGYDATSVSDLATHLGLTKSAIYHHFASKEALLQAALDDGLDALSAAISEIEGAGTSAEDRLRAAVEAAVRILVERLPSVTLLLRVRGNSPVERAALLRRRRIDDQLTTLVQAAVADGRVRDDLSPELISRLLFGMVNSLVEWYHPGGPVSADDLARTVSTLAFDGLLRD
ncbi:TetR/AcrR family transcriptional regulator [Alteromonas gracilis]